MSMTRLKQYNSEIACFFNHDDISYTIQYRTERMRATDVRCTKWDDVVSWSLLSSHNMAQ